MLSLPSGSMTASAASLILCMAVRYCPAVMLGLAHSAGGRGKGDGCKGDGEASGLSREDCGNLQPLSTAHGLQAANDWRWRPVQQQEPAVWPHGSAPSLSVLMPRSVPPLPQSLQPHSLRLGLQKHHFHRLTCQVQSWEYSIAQEPKVHTARAGSKPICMASHHCISL